MKKIIAFSLCIMLIMIPCLVFADSGSPVILPVTDGNSGLTVNFASGQTRIYSSNSSPVYLTFSHVNDNDILLCFSDSPNAQVYYSSDGISHNAYNLNTYYNGYYYTISNFQFDATNTPYYVTGDFTSIPELIDHIDSTVFSVTFDLTYLVDGSISWLSTFAQAVKNSPLLLFFVIFVFVGICIGLMQRFSRR